MYPIRRLCKYLKVSSSGYYHWLDAGRPIRYSFDEFLANQIEKIFYESYKGYRYITMKIALDTGVIYNEKTIYRYMKILGLSSPIRKKRFKCCTIQEKDKKARTVCDNVLARNFKAYRPLEKLVTDVSYIYCQEGRMYISVIKNLYDNSILAYITSKFNDMNIVMKNIKEIINDKTWNPTHECIIHSDQGFQYTNIVYIKYLDSFGITVSHSRKANCYDNACCENFFSHLKSECLELDNDIPKTFDDLIKKVDDYIYFYNYQRPQKKLKGMTPMMYRESYLQCGYL